MKTKIAPFASAVALLGTLLYSLPVSAAEADADWDFTIGPNYTNALELAVREGVPRGTLHMFTMYSEDSKIYPGTAKDQPGFVPFHRLVCVYVPQQYVAGTPAPFIVVQDGLGYGCTSASKTLALIAMKRPFTIGSWQTSAWLLP